MWVQQREYVEVGGALAGARERAGLTQQQVAKLLRKPQSFVSSYERGQRRIDILEFLRIADVLGGDPLKLMQEIMNRGTGSKRPNRR